MEIEILESRVSDNFYYGLVDDGEAALIDPIDGTGAVEWIRDEGLELRYLINTHHHRDHTGGNPTVLGSFAGADLVAGADDAEEIQEGDVDRTVRGGDTLPLGQATLEVLDTPGHTLGHVSFLTGRHLLSGDTIFVGGAGNCSFGGDAGRLFRTFRDVLARLDDDVRFYPGHDYAVRDIEFILSIEPDNRPAREKLEEAKGAPAGEIFLTTLGEERDYNPFFRYEDPQLREHLAETQSEVWEECSQSSNSPDETAFRTVRALRNEW